MSFYHFSDDVPLTSPRSLLVCQRNGINPKELMQPTQSEMRERLSYFPPQFRRQAEEALEGDRLELVKRLTAEFAKLNMNQIQPAELVAFPELQKMVPQAAPIGQILQNTMLSARSNTRRGNTSPRTQQSLYELNYVKSTAAGLRNSYQRYEEQYQREAYRRAESLEKSSRDRAERLARCRQHIAANQLKKSHSGLLQTQKYEMRLATYSDDLSQRLSAYYEQAKLERQKKREFIFKREHNCDRRLQDAQKSSVEHYRLQITYAQERRKLMLAARFYARRERRALSTSRVELAQAAFEAYLEHEKALRQRYFEEHCEHQKTAIEQKRHYLERRNADALTKHEERTTYLRRRLIADETMRRNRLFLYREQSRVEEQLYKEKREHEQQEFQVNAMIQAELRQRRFRRQTEQQEFQKFIATQNDEIRRQQHAEQLAAANIYKQQLYHYNAQHEARHQAEMVDLMKKRAAVFQVQVPRYGISKVNVEKPQEKVIIADYLVDQGCIRRGYVEVQGWREEI